MKNKPNLNLKFVIYFNIWLYTENSRIILLCSFTWSYQYFIINLAINAKPPLNKQSMSHIEKLKYPQILIIASMATTQSASNGQVHVPQLININTFPASLFILNHILLAKHTDKLSFSHFCVNCRHYGSFTR